jgi:hypothetical protein
MAKEQAGTVYVQVLPGFEGWHDRVQDGLNKAMKGVKADLDVVPKVDQKAVKKELEKAGEGAEIPVKPKVDVADTKRQAKKVAGAFVDEFRSRMASGLRAMPKVKLDSDATKVDRTMARIRKEMKALSKVKIGANMSGEQVMAQVARLRAALDKLNGKKVNVRAQVDIAAAHSALASFEASVAKAGHRSGGAFAAEFSRGFASSAEALPDLKITGDSSPLQRELARIRAEALKLSKLQVGIDIDEPTLKRKLDALHASAVKVNREARTLGESFDSNVVVGHLDKLAEHWQHTGKAAHDVLEQIKADMGGVVGRRVNLDITSAQAHAEIAGLDAALDTLERKSTSVDIKSNAGKLRQELKLVTAQIEHLDEQDATVEVEVKVKKTGAFGNLLARTLAGGEAALPEIEITADSTDVDRKLAAIRSEIVALQDPEIHAHLDDAQLLAKLDELMRKAKEAERTAITVQPRMDASQFYRVLAGMRSAMVATGVQAHQTVSDINRELASIHAKRVNLELTSEEALAQVAVLKRRLDQLARDTTSISVEADVAATHAALAGVEAHIKHLDGQSATVKVKTDTEGGGGKGLGLPSLSLRIRVLIGLATAGAGAIGGLGAAVLALGAASVVGGASLAAVVVGVANVTEAMKAQEAASRQAGQTAAQEAAQRLSAAHQVLGAQESLANAQLDVANTARRSSASVRAAVADQARAERDLSDAQRDGLRAQDDLNAARDDASRTLEDQQNRVRDDALAQRAAILEVKDAEAELAKVRDDPAATERQRIDAQLTYDQAIQRLSEVSLSYKRSQADAAKMAKAGVEGSAQVVSASEALVAAQRRIGDAQVAATDAAQHTSEARIDAAQAGAQAAQQVVAAQRQLADAETAVAVQANQAGTAQEKMREAFDKLSPEALRLVEYLKSQSGEWLLLQRASQQFAPGAQRALQTLAPHFAHLNGNVATLSGSFGDFLGVVADGLVRMEPTFDLIASSSTVLFPRFGQSLSRAGGAVGVLVSDMLPLAEQAFGVVDSMSALVRSLSPFIAAASGPLLGALDSLVGNLQVLGPLLDALAQPAADLTTALGTDLAQGLQNLVDGGLGEFLQAVVDMLAVASQFMPIVGQIAGTLAHSLIPAVNGLAFAMGPLVSVMRIFADVLDLIPEPLLSIVTGVVLLNKVSGPLNRAFADMSAGLGRMSDRAATAAGKLGVSTAAVGRMQAGFERANGALTKISVALPLVGLAFVAAGAIIDADRAKTEAAAEAGKKYAEALLLGGKGAREAQAAIEEKKNKLGEAGILERRDLITTLITAQATYRARMEEMGKLGLAQLRVADATKVYNAAVRDYGEDSEQATIAGHNLALENEELERTQRKAADATKSHTEKLREQQDQLLAMQDARVGLQRAQMAVGRAQQRIADIPAQRAEAEVAITDAQAELAAAQKEHGKDSKEARQAENRLGDARQRSLDIVGGLKDAQLELSEAQSRYVAQSGEAAAATAKAAGATGTALDKARLRGVNDALVELIGKFGSDLPTALLDMAGGMDEADAKARGLTVSVNAAGEQILALPGANGKPPIEIKFKDVGLEEAKARLDSFVDFVGGRVGAITNLTSDAISRIGMVVDKFTSLDAVGAGLVASALGKIGTALAEIPSLGAVGSGLGLRMAGGGSVPGSGGGDTVPAMLTPGEFVVSKPAVHAVGAGRLAAWHHTARRFAAGGLVRPIGYAAGGPVGGAAGSVALAGFSTGITALADVVGAVSAISRAALPAAAALGGALVPALAAYQTASRRVADATRTDWLSITASVRDAVNLITATYFSALRLGLLSVDASVTRTALVWATQWQAIRASVADPVRWMLVYPFNALIGAWNVIDTNFAVGKPIAPVVPGFAAGGPVPTDAGTPGKDSVLAWLMPGEFVAPVPMVQQIGMDNLEAARRSVLRGGSAEGVVPGYEAGGAVTKALTFAASQVGKPYIWGGVGPDGYDCSGLMSAVANVALGAPAYQRRFTTADFAAGRGAGGFVPGTNSTFVIGVSDAHMAGNLAGHNLESTTKGGRSGVRVDGDASGPLDAQFTKGAFALPQIGGTFIPSAGGAPFDVGALLDSAFAPTRAAIAALVPTFGPGTMAAGASAAMVRMLGAVSDWAKTNLAAGTTPAGGATGPVADQVRAVAARYGWGDGPQWNALDMLFGRESGMNPNAQNPTSSAYGLAQFLDGTWASTGIAKTSDPTLQAEAAMRYIAARYTDPMGAWNFWQGHHWYDDGGYLPPGISLAYNGTGHPEPVLSANQWDNLAAGGGSGGQFTGELHLDGGQFLGLVRGEIRAANDTTALSLSRRTRM